MTMPLFNFYDISERWYLYRALRELGPKNCWEVMLGLYEADEKFYFSDPENERERESLVRNAISFMKQTPSLRHKDLPALAHRFGTYGPRLQLESLFIIMWLGDRETLFEQIVEVNGRDHLEAATSGKIGTIALPFHTGPSYPVGPLIALDHPTTMVFNRINFDELKSLINPALDAEAFSLDSTNVARAGIRALRRGRVFSIFPEVDPRGHGTHTTRIPFLGTTVLAPLGPAIMSHISQAPILPASLSSNNDGTFVLTYHRPIMPPETKDELSVKTAEVWAQLEQVLLKGPVEDWEIWCEFNKLVPQET